MYSLFYIVRIRTCNYFLSFLSKSVFAGLKSPTQSKRACLSGLLVWRLFFSVRAHTQLVHFKNGAFWEIIHVAGHCSHSCCCYKQRALHCRYTLLCSFLLSIPSSYLPYDQYYLHSEYYLPYDQYYLPIFPMINTIFLMINTIFLMINIIFLSSLWSILSSYLPYAILSSLWSILSSYHQYYPSYLLYDQYYLPISLCNTIFLSSLWSILSSLRSILWAGAGIGRVIPRENAVQVPFLFVLAFQVFQKR